MFFCFFFLNAHAINKKGMQNKNKTRAHKIEKVHAFQEILKKSDLFDSNYNIYVKQLQCLSDFCETNDQSLSAMHTQLHHKTGR